MVFTSLRLLNIWLSWKCQTKGAWRSGNKSLVVCPRNRQLVLIEAMYPRNMQWVSSSWPSLETRCLFLWLNTGDLLTLSWAPIGNYCLSFWPLYPDIMCLVSHSRAEGDKNEIFTRGTLFKIREAENIFWLVTNVAPRMLVSNLTIFEVFSSVSKNVSKSNNFETLNKLIPKLMI